MPRGTSKQANGAGKRQKSQGLRLRRLYTQPNRHPFDTVGWVKRDVTVLDDNGLVLFEQKTVEAPASWSETALQIAVHKYFFGALGSSKRERSIKQLIARVADTLTEWGRRDRYFASNNDANIFRDEMTYLLLHQKMAFNSPVWFNLGVEPHPQCSACFILGVEDSMTSILDLAKTEAMLFKFGSGAGSNLSTLRSSHELLHSGGTSSGPLAFMRGLDAFAGAIKAGGRSRRAAKMVILNADHPDIFEFIQSKAREEDKARALIHAGYDARFNIEHNAYESLAYQNANHSVRVTDAFMHAVENNTLWHTRNVLDGKVVESMAARRLLRAMAKAAHACGDPGVQFDTTTNAYHTCPKAGRINASNPCSEFVFLDNTACNLASLNLRAFQRSDGNLDIAAFKHAIQLTVLAQEIMVDRASYPSHAITQNSKRFRPLGLGYTNLGALLMTRGLAYDSEQACNYAAAITALMTGTAYAASAVIARDARGAFDAYRDNKRPFMAVIKKHQSHLRSLNAAMLSADLLEATHAAWHEARREGAQHGYRNAQVTAIAPTGTISLMMDCDTTGIEPELALVKYKRLVGGGQLKIVNQCVAATLKTLGYDAADVAHIEAHLLEHEALAGDSMLKPEHRAIFDCALPSTRDPRVIDYHAHVRMLAACQPFVSGAISKTINMPHTATEGDIEALFIEAWRLGLKSLAVYRDGSKGSQPVTTCSTSGVCEGVNPAGFDS